MTAPLWLPPLVRALATALLVVSASAVAESAGPFWGALIASLPVSAGPAYVFLAMQHDAGFVAASALSSFAANASTGLFLTIYGALAARVAPSRSLAVAVMAWLAASLAIEQFPWTPATAFVLNLAVYGGGFALLDATGSLPPSPATPARRRRFDILARAASVAAFVTLVVGVSALLGPVATGIAAVFPVSLISLIVIVRPRIGGAASALFAANALRAMLGFGMTLLVLRLAIEPFGVAVALACALLTSAAWSAGLLALRRMS